MHVFPYTGVLRLMWNHGLVEDQKETRKRLRRHPHIGYSLETEQCNQIGFQKTCSGFEDPSGVTGRERQRLSGNIHFEARETQRCHWQSEPFYFVENDLLRVDACTLDLNWNRTQNNK